MGNAESGRRNFSTQRQMRIRTIKPAFWSNEKLAALPDFARLLAIGLLNYADDHGYFWANCLMVRGALFPFEEDSTKIRRGLAHLATQGYVELGKTSDGREIGRVVKFSVHQRVDKPQVSEIQPLAIFQEGSTNDLGMIADQSALYRKGREGKGRDILPGSAPAEAERPRERNLQFDALCLFEGIPFDQVGAAGGRIGKALSSIKAITPEVTPEEIERRGRNYESHFNGAARTAAALAKHWGKCHEPNRRTQTDQRPNSRGFQQTADFSQFTGDTVKPVAP